MKRLLVPIDFSEGSKTAAMYAIHLAGKEKTELYFFHIFPNQIMVPDSSFPAGIDSDAFMNSDFISGLKDQSELKMDQFKKEMQLYIDKIGLTNIIIKSEVSGGDPEWGINEICDQIKPIMIIMGTRGEGKKGFLEGSTAEKIMIKSFLPVIAVPESFIKFHLKHVMYATSFNQVDPLKIEKIFTLFRHFKIIVHAVHIELTGKAEESEEKMNDLKSLFRNDLKDREVHFHLIDSDSKIETLEEFVTKNKIDLIAFIAHKNNIFKSLFSSKITKKDFFKLSLPMLAMHEKVF